MARAWVTIEEEKTPTEKFITKAWKIIKWVFWIFIILVMIKRCGSLA
ncbi:MAG: hypothetical protein IJG49_02455 [Erysipelotrichaceae bacterium]|nr:hypothetical protein [Erysipelotrichaceae bacterium]